LAALARHRGRFRDRWRFRECGVLLARASRDLRTVPRIVLSSGAGAIGVRLGMPVALGGRLLDRPLGLGDPADVSHMDSMVGWPGVPGDVLLVLLLVALAGAAS